MNIIKIINEEINSLLDKDEEYVRNLINNSKLLGSGDNGKAYLLTNGNVLKITRSGVEAYIFKNLVNKNPEHITHVYWFVELGEDEYRAQHYGYEREYVDVNWTEEENVMWDEVLLEIFNDTNTWNSFKNISYKDKINFIRNAVDETIGDTYWTTDGLASQYNFESVSEERIHFLMDGMEKVVRELKKYNIFKWMDGSLDNFGIKRNGNFAVFDLGYY